MRNPKRIYKIILLIGTFWNKYPDLRFFQMITCLQNKIDPENTDLFNYEDDKLIQFLEKTINN